ncbi:hypothetical protein M9458_009435 [Cirrhinus mrigala]|uniref:Uncharacterized protein n=1 Tax=Cirrhinus mrigala TaxID=683832 RepID=A0ABD0RBG4_CIRMR
MEQTRICGEVQLPSPDLQQQLPPLPRLRRSALRREYRPPSKHAFLTCLSTYSVLSVHAFALRLSSQDHNYGARPPPTPPASPPPSVLIRPGESLFVTCSRRVAPRSAPRKTAATVLTSRAAFAASPMTMAT